MLRAKSPSLLALGAMLHVDNLHGPDAFLTVDFVTSRSPCDIPQIPALTWQTHQGASPVGHLLKRPTRGVTDLTGITREAIARAGRWGGPEGVARPAGRSGVAVMKRERRLR